MTDHRYEASRTALLLVDPYNDFLSEGGEAVSCGSARRASGGGDGSARALRAGVSATPQSRFAAGSAPAGSVGPD